MNETEGDAVCERVAVPVIDDRGDGNVTIFFKNWVWKRRLSRGSAPDWFFKGPKHRISKVSRKLGAGLDEICRNPNAVRLKRFPRLPDGVSSIARKTHVDSMTDILPTSEFEGQEIWWLVDGIIPRNSLVLLCAPPGSYKTWFGLSMMDAVSRGADFIGRATIATTVLYLNNDDPLHVIAQRRNILGLQEGKSFKIWGNWVGEEPPPIGDERLEEFARLHNPFIIFDPFAHFHSADENSTRRMAIVMIRLRRLVSAGATVLVIHHGPKSEVTQYRGSTEILAAVDVAFAMSVNKKQGDPLLTLDCFKHRLAETFTLTLKPDFDHGRFELVKDFATQKADKVIEKLKGIIRIEPGLCQKDVIAKSHLPERKVTDALNANENVHWKVARPGGKTKLYYPMDSIGG